MASFVVALKSVDILSKLMKFLGVGAIATIIQYILLISFVEVFYIEELTSSITSFLLSSTINYILNYNFTFNSRIRHALVFPKFLLIASSACLINALIFEFLNNVLNFYYLVSQIISTIVVFVWNFLANYFWSFNDK